MSLPDDNQSTEAAASVTGDVTDNGVFQVVLDGYDAIYDGLLRGETFNRLWRTNAYGGDFPEEFAHIGFLTVAEAQRMHELLQVGPGDALADLACGAGGPGLWMAKQSGASLIGADPSAAGLVGRPGTSGCRWPGRPLPFLPGHLRAHEPSRRRGRRGDERRRLPVRTRQARRARRVLSHPPAWPPGVDYRVRGRSCHGGGCPGGRR